MGRLAWPEYGYKTLGEAIADAEKLIEKIKTNKYSKNDLLKLTKAVNAIIAFVIEDAYDKRD